MHSAISSTRTRFPFGFGCGSTWHPTRGQAFVINLPRGRSGDALDEASKG
jgi:hypothetical protein